MQELPQKISFANFRNRNLPRVVLYPSAAVEQGKQAEFKDRKEYAVDNVACC